MSEKPGIPEDYLTALDLLGSAAAEYKRQTGGTVVIVGGAAVSFYTSGAVLSGDFDLVADISLGPFLLKWGFRKEDAPGMRRGGYYHPYVPRYGFELVSGALFDGRSDRDKALEVTISDTSEVTFPAIEDLIADRLGQFASSNNRDESMLRQAQLMVTLAKSLDREYLKRRIIEETGDPGLIEVR